MRMETIVFAHWAVELNQSEAHAVIVPHWKRLLIPAYGLIAWEHASSTETAALIKPYRSVEYTLAAGRTRTTFVLGKLCGNVRTLAMNILICRRRCAQMPKRLSPSVTISDGTPRHQDIRSCR